MNSVLKEKYIFDLLQKHTLMTSDQVKQVKNNKVQQRQTLIRQQQAASGKGKAQAALAPDLIDIICSLHLELPDGTGEELTDQIIMKHVAQDNGLQFKELDPLELELKTVTKTIPKTFALKHLLLPFELKKEVLSVALYDPSNTHLLSEIERVNQVKIQPYISTKANIRKILSEFFGFQSTISKAETNLTGPTIDLGNLEQYVKISSSAEIASSDQHIQGAVDHLFNYSFEHKASDIHIEPKRDKCLIRIRIDGVLHTVFNLPKVVHPAIISRIKTLSRMDIAEKRRPQDGRIKVNHGGQEAEIRVSTIPVAFGEKAVLRILDPTVMFQKLEQIGFSQKDLEIYKKFITAPHGLMLITGPTGSGKSTTLYSTLKHIATPDKNIITIEDPVEMIHEEFNQISVQATADVTFSNILRNILRQDPDIIMIGEIRDLDTAKYAIQAALTGHLVLSTLHTNDAISSISRLNDLGVAPFLIASTLLGAMAQRLVRTICPHCIDDVTIHTVELEGLGFPIKEEGGLDLKKGRGCNQCRGTGYQGRCGVFEIFPMSSALKDLINSHAPESEIKLKAIEEGMNTLIEDVWQKVLDGMTTFEEAIRITGNSNF